MRANATFVRSKTDTRTEKNYSIPFATKDPIDTVETSNEFYDSFSEQVRFQEWRKAPCKVVKKPVRTSSHQEISEVR